MTGRTHDPDCRLTPAAVPRPSPIEGTGLFAAEPIRRGEVVLRFGGRVLDDAALAALIPPYDWRSPRLRAVYGGHRSPPLLARMRAE